MLWFSSGFNHLILKKIPAWWPWGPDLEIVRSVSGNINVFTEKFLQKEYIVGKKRVIMRRKVSDDVNMFEETKLFMYSSRGNHGYVTKTNNYTRNLRNILLFNLVDTSKPKKTFCEIKSFLGTRFPSSTTISSSAGGTGLQSRCHTRHNAAKAINQNFYHGRPKRL